MKNTAAINNLLHSALVPLFNMKTFHTIIHTITHTLFLIRSSLQHIAFKYLTKIIPSFHS